MPRLAKYQSIKSMIDDLIVEMVKYPEKYGFEEPISEDEAWECVRDEIKNYLNL